MADANVIKEFLVNLGFKVDQASQTRFVAAIEKATTQILKLATGIGAAATAVVAGVARMSSALEQLYFVSQRTGASIRGLQSIGFAFSQMGLSAAQARSSVENLAQFLRSSPGAFNLLSALGVNVNQTTDQMMVQLGQRLRNMPFYVARQYASMMGIDDRTLMVLEQGLGKFSAQYQDMARRIGVSSKQAAEDAHAFMTEFRSMGAVFDLLGIKVEQNLGRKLGDDIARFREFLLDNAGRISQGITQVSRVILQVAEVVTTLAVRTGQIAGNIIDWFERLSGTSKHVIEALALLAAAWRAFNLAFTMTPLGMIVAAIAAVVGAILLLYDDYRSFYEYGREHALLPWDKIVPAIRTVVTAIENFGSSIIDGLMPLWKPLARGAEEAGAALGRLRFDDVIGGVEHLATAIGQTLAPLWPPLRQIFEEVGSALKQIDWPGAIKWITSLAESIALTLRPVVEALGSGLRDVVAALAQLMQGIADVLPVLKHLEPVILAAANALRNIFLAALKIFADQLTGTVKTALRDISDILTFIADLLQHRWQDAWGAAGDAVKTTVDYILDTLGRLKNADPTGIISGLFHGAENLGSAIGGAASSAWSGVTHFFGGLRESITPQKTLDSAKYIMGELIHNLGINQAQAAGLTSRLAFESAGLNPTAVNPTSGAYGLAQWLTPSRRERLREWIAAHPNQTPLQAETGFVIHELQTTHRDALAQIRASSGATPEEVARNAARITGKAYEGAEPWSIEAGTQYADKFLSLSPTPPPASVPTNGGRSGGTTATLHQNTTINVHGSGDPKTTADEIERRQARTNADAIRSMQGAVR